MKRFVKISLGLAIFFTILGISSIIAAFAMGLSWNELKEMAGSGELQMIIDDPRGSTSTVDKESFQKLDIECSAGVVNIFYDNVDEIKVEQQNMKNFSCEADGDTLKISSGKKTLINNSKGVITIKIPKGYVFKDVDMEIGAGQANVEALCTKGFDIEVRAGQAILKNIDATYMRAQAGAGQIQAELVGCKEDYNYDVECGIGEIVIDGDSYGGLGRETHIENPEAQRELDIECGLGQVVIKFQK